MKRFKPREREEDSQIIGFRFIPRIHPKVFIIRRIFIIVLQNRSSRGHAALSVRAPPMGVALVVMNVSTLMIGAFLILSQRVHVATVTNWILKAILRVMRLWMFRSVLILAST